MKKILSLALASALCLSLTAPAFAANQPGDTTITDSIGNTYTLSNPILYTISRAQVETIDRSSMDMFISGFDNDQTWTGAESDLLDKHFWSRMNNVYAVPENTTITLPANVSTSAFCELDFTWENNVASASDYYYTNYPGMQALTLVDTGFIVGIEVWDDNLTDEPASNNGMIHNIITAPENDSYVYGDSIIYFYVPEDATAPNPFGTSTSTNPSAPVFADVAANAYYADAVAWAVEKNITSGTSATTFSPNENCTRAQILAFLWRAAGSPEPKNSPAFTDVKADAYYAKAAAWAAENGMVSGSTFAPDSPCTREMAVEFMWKYAGSPDAAQANFTDISSAAVNWAVEAGVTSGTSATTFSPDNICTRGQIVTFLYRAHQ